MNALACRILLLFVSTLAFFGATSATGAGLFRVYLSFNGNDANPCTVQLPCRLLPAALAAVQDGGEIWMLDSANFNTAPVNINKGVKIFTIPGALGSVVGNGGDAIIINTTGDVTLRNLQILNFNAGVNGVTIQNAGAVHIEKTSIDGFSTEAGSCIRFAVTNSVRLYVDDSFLRHCRNGIYATATVTPENSLISLDNTRIERGFGPTLAYGIWMQGCLAISLRNSVVAWDKVGIPMVGIQTDSLSPGCFSALEVVNSQIFGDDAAVQFANTTAGATGNISIAGSQILGGNTSISISNTAVGGNIHLVLTDSRVAYADAGVKLSNSAADANTRIFAELVRSQVMDMNAAAIDLSATNGSQMILSARDFEIANAVTGVKTRGTSPMLVTLIRSSVHSLTTAVDHGNGKVRLDGNNFAACVNDFVNNGSGIIVSLGNNMGECADTSGLTYITPTIIPGR